MPYEKQHFKDGDVLTAEQLNHMEQGIYDASELTEEKKAELVDAVVAALPVYAGEVEDV